MDGAYKSVTVYLKNSDLRGLYVLESVEFNEYTFIFPKEAVAYIKLIKNLI